MPVCMKVYFYLSHTLYELLVLGKGGRERNAVQTTVPWLRSLMMKSKQSLLFFLWNRSKTKWDIEHMDRLNFYTFQEKKYNNDNNNKKKRHENIQRKIIYWGRLAEWSIKSPKLLQHITWTDIYYGWSNGLCCCHCRAREL